MEIAPIAGVRVMPVMRRQAMDAELTARFEVDYAAEAGDDTYRGSGKKADGAEEADEEEIVDEESSAEMSYEDSTSRVSFFA